MRTFAGGGLLLALLAWPSFAHAERPLVFEHGSPKQIKYSRGVLTITSGPGWVRTRRVHDEFMLTFQYRLSGATSRAGVAVRAWPVMRGWPERGYEVPLAGPEAGTLVGRKEAVRLLTARAYAAPSPGVWHTGRILSAGAQVTVSIDATGTGIFEIGDFPGAILFFVSDGSAEFRNIVIREGPPRPVSALPRLPNIEKGEDPIVPPRVVHEEKPEYTNAAMERQAQGIVEVEAEVLANGTVGAMALTRSLDEDLDLCALAAIRQWRFAPATRNGQPIGVLTRFELTFRLK